MLRGHLLCITFLAVTAVVALTQADVQPATQNSSQQSGPAKVESADKGGALYFSKEQVDKIFASGGSFMKDKEGKFQITAGRRESPGTPEVHAKDTDIFYIVEGTATIVTGGTLVDEKTVAPDEIRGGSVKGGTETTLKKGELIVIPHGTPHWITQVQGTFEYLVVKVR